eukprot:1151823-Pelagomonas_calceolata.AAC.2
MMSFMFLAAKLLRMMGLPWKCAEVHGDQEDSEQYPVPHPFHFSQAALVGSLPTCRPSTPGVQLCKPLLSYPLSILDKMSTELQSKLGGFMSVKIKFFKGLQGVRGMDDA